MRRYRNRIIGVDFDGTLAISKGTYPKITGEIPEVIEYVKGEQANGAQLILITMREDKELEDAIIWCKERGLVFDAVNDNLPLLKEFFENNPRKIFVNEYIDDMNLGGIEFILEEIKRRKEQDLV